MLPTVPAAKECAPQRAIFQGNSEAEEDAQWLWLWLYPIEGKGPEQMMNSS